MAVTAGLCVAVSPAGCPVLAVQRALVGVFGAVLVLDAGWLRNEQRAGAHRVGIGHSWHQYCCAGRLGQEAKDFWEAGIQFGSWEAGAPLWGRSRL